MRIALLQYHPAYLDVTANLNAVERMLHGLEADLVVLPELFATGYFFQSPADLALVAEPATGGPTLDRLRQWSQAHGAVLVAGFAEQAGPLYYNSAYVVPPTGPVGLYRKVHLYYEEKTLFAPGDRGFPVFDLKTSAGEAYRLGVMICYDWRFPESARTLALGGADIIAHPANLVRMNCPRTMPIRALENHVFTITANRTGTEQRGEEQLRFIGQSRICSPAGEVLAEADQEDDAVVQVRIDPRVARDRQITRHNHLFEDRRPEAYALGGD
ncbi:MAG: nitrilase-related carbon-nitrogen hydrolase [Bacteroidota bacterium]